ncbi:MAG TPA: hypothetical protein VLL74_08200, partial [Methanoregula sp.]|nr:hypothetical protein [Methanoregula sp.]
MSRKTRNNPSGFWKMILLLITAGAVVLSIAPVSAEKPFVTVVANGDQSYYRGEQVVFSGMNTASDTTYLFITGPNVPEGGGKLCSPQQKTVSEDPGSFIMVNTKPDKTWEYRWYTSDLRLDAGSYTVYAVSTPESKDRFNDSTTYGTTKIIYKKPFISAAISPATISKGVPFTVSGVAEGIPPEVRIWILGKDYHSELIVSVNPDASFRYEVPPEVTSTLESGRYFVIVQHPMADNRFDIYVSGDYVRSLQLNNGTTVFRISGPGSLQGIDAAEALITALSDQESGDQTLTRDTHTIIPFQVTAPVSATTGVTIAAHGTRSYYQGEKVVFSGYNYDSDTTYLFITGPGTFVTGPGVPDGGGKLTVPRQDVVSGNPGSFDTAQTKADKSWEYDYYTHNLNVDAGSYVVYAVSQPKALDQLNGVRSANVSIILKKPFLTAGISPSSIAKGQTFTINGSAEGAPASVQIWILGTDYYSRALAPVNPDASFRYEVPQEVTSSLESGPYFVIVQHSMQNNRFDIDVSGDFVRSLQLNNGTTVFRISGPGSMQG